MVNNEEDKNYCQRRVIDPEMKVIRSFRTLDLRVYYMGGHPTAFPLQVVTTSLIRSDAI